MATKKKVEIPAVPEQKPLTGMDAYTGEAQLAKIEDDELAPSAIVAYTNNPTFDSSDIVPSLLRLAQGLTPEVQDGSAKPGQWLIPGFKPYDAVTVVPLMFAKRREYRDEEGQAMCVSDDSLTGTGDPGGICEACEMNKWGGDRGKRKPPQCTFMYAYMVYVLEADSIALLYFKKTSIGIGRMLNAMVAQKGMRNTAIRLTSKSQSGKKGSYFTPMIAPLTADLSVEAINAAAAKGF
jgi:hypothetical protein